MDIKKEQRARLGGAGVGGEKATGSPEPPCREPRPGPPPVLAAQQPVDGTGPGLWEPFEAHACPPSAPGSLPSETMLLQFGAQTYDQHMEMW